MNRIIKFRVWDESSNKFYSKEVLDNLPLKVFLASKNIQQFIGLLDKNGKEIYEGDIIEINETTDYYPPQIGIVEYSLYHNLCVYRLILIEDFNNKGDWCRGSFSFDIFGKIKRKIIGNIFENPTLLK